MRIDKDSHKEVFCCWGTGIGISLILFLFFGFIALTLIPVFLIVVFNCFVTAFFRVPVRNVAGNERIISSVADGEIVVVEKSFEKEFLKCECMKISVYMDFFDVHANFWPVNGVVCYHKYHPGKFKLAYTHKSSEINEHYSVAIRTVSGAEFLFKQISGTFARRIVNYAQEGLAITAGQQCGVIKFGSRIDMYLPLDATIKVKVGDKVRACESVIAELN